MGAEATRSGAIAAGRGDRQSREWACPRPFLWVKGKASSLSLCFVLNPGCRGRGRQCGSVERGACEVPVHDFSSKPCFYLGPSSYLFLSTVCLAGQQSRRHLTVNRPQVHMCWPFPSLTSCDFCFKSGNAIELIDWLIHL